MKVDQRLNFLCDYREPTGYEPSSNIAPIGNQHLCRWGIGMVADAWTLDIGKPDAPRCPECHAEMVPGESFTNTKKELVRYWCCERHWGEPKYTVRLFDDPKPPEKHETPSEARRRERRAHLQPGEEAGMYCADSDGNRWRWDTVSGWVAVDKAPAVDPGDPWGWESPEREALFTTPWFDCNIQSDKKWKALDRVQALKEAAEAVVKMMRNHKRIYEYEKPHYVMDVDLSDAGPVAKEWVTLLALLEEGSKR